MTTPKGSATHGWRTSIPKLHSIRFKDGMLADNVIHPDFSDNTDLYPMPQPLTVLQGAAMAMLQEVAVIGYTVDGEVYIASNALLDRTVFMFEHAKTELMDGL